MVKILQFSCDDETGEVLTYEVNHETGEPSIDYYSPRIYGDMSYRERTSKPYVNPKPCVKFPRHGYFSKTKKYQLLKANIIAGSNPISYRMLLLPTLMFCPAFVCAILMLLEVCLHIHCHKKNKTSKEKNMIYRSPFHVISSKFCGLCRDSDAASKIGMLQDKRRNRYDYFRGTLGA